MKVFLTNSVSLETRTPDSATLVHSPVPIHAYITYITFQCYARSASGLAGISKN